MLYTKPIFNFFIETYTSCKDVLDNNRLVFNVWLNPFPPSPESYTMLKKFVNLVNRLLLHSKNTNIFYPCLYIRNVFLPRALYPHQPRPQALSGTLLNIVDARGKHGNFPRRIDSYDLPNKDKRSVFVGVRFGQFG